MNRKLTDAEVEVLTELSYKKSIKKENKMSKELEAFNCILCNCYQNYPDYPKQVRIVKKALKRLEKLERLEKSKPSKELKKFKNKLKETFEKLKNDRDLYLVFDKQNGKEDLFFKRFSELSGNNTLRAEKEKQDKILQIIKDKRVNVGNLIYWFGSHKTYEEYKQDCCQEKWYLHYKDNDDNRCKYWELTQAEFVILKEFVSSKQGHSHD